MGSLVSRTTQICIFPLNAYAIQLSAKFKPPVSIQHVPVRNSHVWKSRGTWLVNPIQACISMTTMFVACGWRQITNFFFLFTFLMTSLPLSCPIYGSLGKAGERRTVRNKCPPCPGTKNPSVTLSSTLLCAPSSFHRLCIKVALCIWKGFPLYTTQISLSPPRLTSQKTLSHLCHVSEGRLSSAGLPRFFSALSPSFLLRYAIQLLKL